MPLILGGLVLVALALLSLSPKGGPFGSKGAQNTIIGALVMGAIVFVLARAGLPWLGLGLALLWSAFKRFSGKERGERGDGREAASAASGEALPKAGLGRMTREEAYAVLGLPVGTADDLVLAEYRRLMKKVHPDQGGTTYLAARLNLAKEVLLGG